jgi:ABC-type uncharacterized transport system fused permease/ATPase subunit
MKQAIVSITSFVIAAFIMALLGYTIVSSDLRYAILAGALGLLGAGLSLNSCMLAQRTENRMKDINATLSRIENFQKEMHNEQKEQAKSNSPIVTSLQALSQYYMDYLAKQAKPKSADEQ